MSLYLSHKHILLWGRFDSDYSRNRILSNLLKQLVWKLSEFKPKLSKWGDWEASIMGIQKPNLLWVPCFRQRDMAAALRWGKKHSIPVVFDPLISAYDKQVFERNKFVEGSRSALRLKKWESNLFQAADLVLADTCGHQRFFVDVLGVQENKVAVVPVGAEESLFKPKGEPKQDFRSPLTVLFYGSFLNLQGPEYIAEAAKLYKGPTIRWLMVGEGPQLARCKEITADLNNVEFLPWLAYEKLPRLIQDSDILLGVFGKTAKAGRVIPNKVYQALACGKPLLTMPSSAYPEELVSNCDNGIYWVAPGDSAALAAPVSALAKAPDALDAMGRSARNVYEQYFSMDTISESLESALTKLFEVRKR